MLAPGLHATLMPASPPRDAALALWPVHDSDESTATYLVLPDDQGRVDRRRVPALVVPLAQLLDDLARTGVDDEHRSTSVRAWGVAARAALDLVARAAIEPSLDAEGRDAWNVTALDEHDRSLRSELARWLPPEAHCSAVADSGTAVSTAAHALDEFTIAVADLMPRSAAAPVVSRLPAWAGRDPVDVGSWRQFLHSVGDDSRCVVGLRLSPPATDNGPFSVSIQVRDADDPGIVASAAQLWSGTATGLPQDAESDLLLALRRGSSMWSPLQRLLDQAHPDTLEISDVEAVQLYAEIGPSLSAIGIEVLVPASMSRSVHTVAHIAPGSFGGTPSSTQTRFGLDSICELTWRASLDGEPLTEAELAELAAASRPLIRLRGGWVVVDPALARKLERRSEVSASDALAAALSGSLRVEDELVQVESSGTLSDLVDRLSGSGAPVQVSAPDGLTAHLRPYQMRGLTWLAEMTELGFGGVLADDMGLGKTVQLIAVHLHRRGAATGPTLVVCPATLMSNWQRELQRFAPSVSVHRYHGPGRDLSGVAPGDVVLSTYGVVRRDADQLAAIHWDLVVADEAQQIKNPSSATARAIRRIPAAARVAMTGTPVENRLADLWALLDWTTPGLLGSAEAFHRNVEVPIERDRDAHSSERFARLIAPFLLRRRKDDPAIVPELPPKTESDLPIALSAEQAGMYRAVVDETLERIGAADGIQRRGLVLGLLTALKQICNHPAQYLHEDGPLPGRSGKLDAFDELIASIIDAGDATLVFTQYVGMGHLLAQSLADAGIDSRFLHGSTPLAERTRMVDDFQAGEFPVLVLSLKAGGTGLNLTAATHVIHYDRWWNPAVENQASDRAWRIGQEHPVQIHRFISEGTIEDRIATMLDDKQRLADAVTSGEAWLTELTDDELAELVRLGDDTATGRIGGNR